MMLSDVCLSVTYIGPKSRTERPKKTKIGIEVAHVTRDSETTFKVKRSKVKVTMPLYSTAAFTHQAVAAVAMGKFSPWEHIATLRSDAVGSAAQGASALTEGGEGWGILWRLPHSLLCPAPRRGH